MTLTLRPHQQRALDALLTASIGRVTIPTGGGKTLVMIEDVKRRLLNATTPQTIVVVAPRILLAVQLYEEFWSALNGTVDAKLSCMFTVVRLIATAAPRLLRFSVMLVYVMLLVFTS